MEYKTKVKAIQWTGENTSEVIEFVNENDMDLSKYYSISKYGNLCIEPYDTMRGRNLIINKNDYVVKFKRKPVIIFKDWQFDSGFKKVIKDRNKQLIERFAIKFDELITEYERQKEEKEGKEKIEKWAYNVYRELYEFEVEQTKITG